MELIPGNTIANINKNNKETVAFLLLKIHVEERH